MIPIPTEPPNPERVSRTIEYHQRDGKTISIHRSAPYTEDDLVLPNCANGNAKLAVERWKEAILSDKEK